MSALKVSGKIEMEEFGDLPELRCPRCGGEHLHHLGVTVFARTEDAPVVVRTRVNSGETLTEVVEADASGNPSGRRDGIAVQFSCEQCEGGEPPNDVIELTIAQHKGSTLIGWRFTEKALARS